MLELQASVGLGARVDGAHVLIPVGQGRIGLIAQERKPYLTNEVIGNARLHEHEWARQEGLVAFAGYPLIVEDRLVGVMAAFAQHPLTEATIQAMGSVANGIALGIKRQAAESALRESEERYRSLFEYASDAIILADPSTRRHLNANQKALQQLGYTKEEFLSLAIDDLDASESGASTAVAMDEFMKTGSIIIERSHRRKDGTLIPVEVSCRLIDYGGRRVVQSFVRDISERKRAEEALKQSLDRLQQTLEATIRAMALTVEMRDPYTAGHQQRVATLAAAVAVEMGLTEDRSRVVRLAALIHDIGKISVPSEILNKPGHLTEIELALIKGHSESGHDILKTIDFPWPIARIVLQHHERMDGTGYPVGLAGENILLEARILAVADTVEAMSSHRPYRPALGVDAALAEIELRRGTFYDPQVVDACMKLFVEKDFRWE